MRSHFTRPIATRLLIAWFALAAAAPALATPGRLKLVRPTGRTQQWPVPVNGWWALIDERGNLNTEPYLDWIGDIDNGQAPAAFEGRFGVLNGVGDWRVTPRYEHLDRFFEGYAAYRHNGKTGFINVAGSPVLKPVLEDARRFRDGLAVVRTANGCGYINAAMKPVVPPIFAVTRSLHQNLGVVAIDAPRPGSRTARALEQLSDTPLAELVDVKVLASPEHKNGKPPTRLWGCIDKSGRLVWLDRSGQIEAMSDFGNDLAPVRVGGRWGFINRTFKIAVAPRWDDARPFVRGYAAVRQGDKWGYLNAAGRVAIKPQWDEAYDFDETLALVRRGDQWGYIDVTGRVVIEPQFSSAQAFLRGRARVNAGWDAQPDAYGYINVAGQIVFDPRQGGQAIVDIRRGGRGEIIVNGGDGRSNGFRSRLVNAPPPRPTPDLGVIPEYLYDEGVSIDDAADPEKTDGPGAGDGHTYPTDPNTDADPAGSVSPHGQD